MANAASIQQKINYGVGKAGNILGFTYQWYRPNPAGPAIQTSNLRGTVNVFITPTPTLVPGPTGSGKPDRYAAFDPTLFLAGDYLVGPETYFIGEYLALTGISHLFLCNETFLLGRREEGAVGRGYVAGGQQNNTPIATGFPGWVKANDRKQPTRLDLPGEVPMPTVNILLPASISEQILRGDQLITSDTVRARWTVQSADLTPNGWSIIAIGAGSVSQPAPAP